MKKIIATLTLIMMSLTTLSAMDTFALKHTNPMPNLMRIAMKNADILGIDAKQKEALKAWASENKPKMKQMIQKVMSEEKRLLEDALTTDNDSVKEAEVMLETRKQIIATKTKCRQTLKSILTPEQYTQVITIYNSVR